MENEKLKVGDVVTLNSGGPKMTINGIQTNGHVVCVWFSEDEFKNATLNPYSLKKA